MTEPQTVEASLVPADTYPHCAFCGGVMVCRVLDVIECVQCNTDALCAGARPEVS